MSNLSPGVRVSPALRQTGDRVWAGCSLCKVKKPGVAGRAGAVLATLAARPLDKPLPISLMRSRPRLPRPAGAAPAGTATAGIPHSQAALANAPMRTPYGWSPDANANTWTRSI